jgi:hypothetical protein
VTVRHGAREPRWTTDDDEPIEAPFISGGVLPAALIVAGAWMLYHAKTADPEEQAPGYKAWRWVVGGIVCLGAGAYVGARVIGLIGSQS